MKTKIVAYMIGGPMDGRKLTFVPEHGPMWFEWPYIAEDGNHVHYWAKPKHGRARYEPAAASGGNECVKYEFAGYEGK